MIKKSFFAGCVGLMACFLAQAQSGSITLEDCYLLARQHYPALKKMEIYSRTADLNIRNFRKHYIPQVTITGQATYQSQAVDYAVLLGGINAPIEFTPPAFNKDQYRLSAEIDQLLYDGGRTKAQIEMAQAQAGLEKQNVEVELYAINQRLNTLFFSIFLTDAQLELNQLKISNLTSQLDKMEAAYRYGTAFASDLNEIKAEIQNTLSVNLDLEGNRSAFLGMLSTLIGREVASSDELIRPEPPLFNRTIQRPELELFDKQTTLYDLQAEHLKSNLRPTLRFFFQGAYGRPTLNPISNDFGAWYMTGIRLNWSLGNLYTLKDQREIYHLNRQTANTDRETFVRNLQMEIDQLDESIKKYTAMIAQDHKTIVLREAVTQSAAAQLENGVITTHEYLQKVNLENAARQNLVLHEIQLLQAQYNIKTQTGHEQ